MDSDFYKTLLWRAARAAALARDGYACTAVHGYDYVCVGDDDEWDEVAVVCGESGDDLHVHHIQRPEDGGGEYTLDNLVTLCSSCHARLHAMLRAALPQRMPDLALAA